MTEPRSGLEQDLIAHLQAELKEAEERNDQVTAQRNAEQDRWLKAEKRIAELESLIAKKDAALKEIASNCDMPRHECCEWPHQIAQEALALKPKEAERK